MKHYNIAVIGLGSIGCRHIFNIKRVLEERNITYSIDLFRSSRTGKEMDEEIEKIINKIYYDYENVQNYYDIIYVTNPTHLHFDTIKRFSSKTKHMFIEKPVFDRTDLSLDDLPLKEEGIYYVACPLRYTNVIEYLKNEYDLKKVYCARVICSSYLPAWRPHVDYRVTYSAIKEQGGGVSIDLIHEWDYINYLFGLPEQVLNIRGKYSNLEINSDDLSIYIGKYQKMAVEVHLDYFGREPIREIQLFTEEETIVGDLLKSEVRFLSSGRKLSFNETRNDYQLKEMAHFFNVIEGKKENDNDLRMALQTLKIAKDGTF
ncbi:Gfo/Idh/MocA family oxidoreductase [Metabacillus sp. B2-18]|uniref:Gfo/Idh/MocA family oxidoreductase n=1 Tax=Metabacillus sp. B2-18 TaxID=2897333 RepID=UPI001E612778|nr:Gfo/Idh/MocA family oxidoreductase [Metabacillus sp. B2-18]UGB30424.1 Gfo/Idh/MocA family oxidoreductase [Metabacillus sp. B2-18]